MSKFDLYARHIVVTVSAVVTALVPYYGADKWFTAVMAGLVALTAVLVPSTKKVSTAAVTSPVAAPQAEVAAKTEVHTSTGFDTGNRPS